MAHFRVILTAAAFAATLPAAALADDDDFPRRFHRDGVERLFLRVPDGWAYRGWWQGDDDRRAFRHRGWGDDDDDDRPRRRRRRDRDDDNDDDD